MSEPRLCVKRVRPPSTHPHQHAGRHIRRSWHYHSRGRPPHSGDPGAVGRDCQVRSHVKPGPLANLAAKERARCSPRARPKLWTLTPIFLGSLPPRSAGAICTTCVGWRSQSQRASSWFVEATRLATSHSRREMLKPEVHIPGPRSRWSRRISWVCRPRLCPW